jgi:hypothetical protein
VGWGLLFLLGVVVPNLEKNDFILFLDRSTNTSSRFQGLQIYSNVIQYSDNPQPFFVIRLKYNVLVFVFKPSLGRGQLPKEALGPKKGHALR